jgi:hypothetical protein
VDQIWKGLRALDEEHERLFTAASLERPRLAVAAAEYQALYPYSYHCSDVEPALYYCVEQLRRDADALDERLLGRPVSMTSVARSSAPLTKMSLPVERFFFVLLGSLERIHAVEERLLPAGGTKAPWPSRPLDKLTSREAVGLFLARLGTLAAESRAAREAVENGARAPK